MGVTDSDLSRLQSVTAAAVRAQQPRSWTEWRYEMRRSMQEVSPGVFLGPYSAAQRSNVDSLMMHNITHIVCVRQKQEARFIRPNLPEQICYLTLDIADRPEEDIAQHFETVNTFVDRGLAQGGRVLIHGNTGQSRSAALAVAYVMSRYGLGAEDALAVVRSRRCCATPNPGFMKQLEDYAAQLSGNCPTKKLKLTDD